MPAVMIDVDYQHFHEDRNITERTTDNQPSSPNSARSAIDILDQAYARARARLIDSLPAGEGKNVPVMVPVPEKALSRVQAAISGVLAGT